MHTDKTTVLGFNEFINLLYETKSIPETKLNKLLTFMSKKDKSDAIKLASSFFSGMTKDELTTIQIAAECIKGKSDFYKSIGYKPDSMIEQAWDILNKIYGKQLSKFENK